MAGDDRLVGTWRLLSYRLVGSRGRIRYPYGDDARGAILYGADGYMAVSIMSAQRTPFAGVDILRRTTEEAAAATRTYLSYSGPYEVLPDRVIHYVELSLFPNWTGSRQERYYAFAEGPAGGRLELSTAPIFGGGGEAATQTPHAHLVWERCAARESAR